MLENKTGSSYTFDSFKITVANRTAFEKAKQFAENVDSESLAIFGGTATGKTHLLYSVKNAIKQNNPELTVILTTTADMRSALADILNSGGTSEQLFSFPPRRCRSTALSDETALYTEYH